MRKYINERLKEIENEMIENRGKQVTKIEQEKYISNVKGRVLELKYISEKYGSKYPSVVEAINQRIKNIKIKLKAYKQIQEARRIPKIQ